MVDQLDVINNIASTYIDLSSLHGHGLFASHTIERQTEIAILDGQAMSWNHYDRIRDALSLLEDVKDYLFLEWNALSEETLLVRPFRTKYSFINHSRCPNLKIFRRNDEFGLIALSLVAIGNIFEGEELLLDYRDEPLRDSYLNGHGATYL